MLRNYASLRSLIKEFGGDQPIWSGEWGWSDCHAPCTPPLSNPARVQTEAEQGAFLARSWLVNALAGVEVSIWYEWQDGRGNGSDTESHFGVVRRNDTSHKMAYGAAVTIAATLGAADFEARVPLPPPLYLLRFSGGRYALWSSGAEAELQLPLEGCYQHTACFGEAMPAVCHGQSLRVTGEPSYLVAEKSEVPTTSKRAQAKTDDDERARKPPTIDDLCGEWMVTADLEISAPLSSLRGGCISGPDVLSVGALTFPPFVLGTASEQVETGSLSDPLRPDHGEPGFPDPLTGFSGRLLLNGTAVMATRSRWCANRVEREGTAKVGGVTVRVSTVVTMAAVTRAVLFEMEISAAPNQQQQLVAGQESVEVAVEMQGIVRMFNSSADWTFGHATVLKNETDQLTVASAFGGRGVTIVDKMSRAASALVLTEQPSSLELTPAVSGSGTPLVGGRGVIVVDMSSMAAPAAFRLGVALAVAEEEDEAIAAARSLAPGGGIDAFSKAVSAAQSAWEDRWQAAFTPGNGHYSGHLPTLQANDEAADDVARVYYLSVLSFLSCEKTIIDTHTATDWRRAYTTGGPRTGVVT